MQTITSRLRPLLAVFGLISLLSLTACDTDGEADTDTDSDTGDGDGDGLEIVGDYVDDYMSEHSIDETEWLNAGSRYAVVEWDNDAGYVLAQNDEANEYNPGLYSRFDWTWDGEQLYYCQSVYDGPDLDAARSGGADASDLATGCGMFPWSSLTPQ